ncbi:MAG: hypothetical protein QM771_14795 [Nitrospira sp.]
MDELQRLAKRGAAKGEEKSPVKPLVLNIHFVDSRKKQAPQLLLIFFPET